MKLWRVALYPVVEMQPGRLGESSEALCLAAILSSAANNTAVLAPYPIAEGANLGAARPNCPVYNGSNGRIPVCIAVGHDEYELLDARNGLLENASECEMICLTRCLYVRPACNKADYGRHCGV